MFAAVSDLYADQWSDFFHFAIFENGSEDWDSALDRTHRRYLDALAIKPGDEVIELACGRGGFAEYLAANSRAGRVLGIDVSRAQLSRAVRRKRPNLRFLHHDIMRVDELDARFDAVVLMDADCYLPDKRLAVAKIANAMKPGARFLLIAWCKQQGLNRLQEELVLEPFMRFWDVPSLETAAGYRRHFRRAGLRLIEEVDLNDKVGPNWELGYERAIKAVREVGPAQAARYVWKGLTLGKEGLRLVKDQFHAALYIKAAFDAGFLRYTLLLAEKA